MVQKQEIEIPQEIKRIAIPASWITFEEVRYKGEYIIILKNKRIELEGGIIVKLVPKGAFKVNPGDVRTVKYLTIDARGKKTKLYGTIVFERTDETIDGFPVFRATTEEPEAFLYGFLYKGLYQCTNFRIINVQNVIEVYENCITYEDAEDISVDLIIPVEKVAVIDYAIEGRKHRDIILWNDGNPVSLQDVYEEPRPEELL